jgi:predicted nucleic acid-binding Zn ribbon protein
MIYEYECPTDKTVVSIERKMNDPEVIPTCGTCQGNLIRLWSAPSVVFNGPGFYSTDNPKR